MPKRSLKPAAAERSSNTARRGRGRPSDHTGDQTRTEILRAAQRLFGEAGFKGMTMDRLATECGLNVRALYHHFPSKRALFQAATDDALIRFGSEVAERVFTHEALADRIKGYTDVFRSLYRSDPHLLSFIGMVLVDALSNDLRIGANSSSSSNADLQDTGEALRRFLETLVDDAIASGEVHSDLDREGALLLLNMLGMGLALSTLGDNGSFPAMLDALDRLTDGSLFTGSSETRKRP